MMNEGDHGSNSSHKRPYMPDMNQVPSLSFGMHAPLRGHHICPYCQKSFTRQQALGSHLNVHKEIQHEAIMERRSIVLALPAKTTTPESITSPQALGGHQSARGKEIKEMEQKNKVIMAGRTEVLPLTFMNSAILPHDPRVMKRGFDWFGEGHGYAARSNLRLKKLDPEIGYLQAHQKEEQRPQLVDFMNTLKHGQDTGSSSTNNVTNSEMRVLRQVEQGEKVHAMNTDLTLTPDGIDLTLKL